MPLPQSYVRKVDGQKLYAQHVNELQVGLEEVTQVPTLWTRRITQVLAQPNGTTVTTLGTIAPTVTANTSTSSDDADGVFIDYATTNVGGNVAGWNTAVRTVRRDWDPELVFRCKTSTPVTFVRYWIGSFSGTPTASATPALHYAAFRYDATADSASAFWRCLTDNGSGTPTIATTNVAVTANTAYTFRIRMSANDVRFYINDVIVATIGTTLPTSSTDLNWYTTVTTLGAVVRNIKLSRVGISHE